METNKNQQNYKITKGFIEENSGSFFDLAGIEDSTEIENFLNMDDPDPRKNPEVEPEKLPGEDPGVAPEPDPGEDDDDDDDNSPFLEPSIGDDPDEMDKKTTIF